MELMLATTLLCAGFYLGSYIPRHAKAGEPVFALASYFLTYAPIESVHRPAYVVPDSLELWDTPAEIRTEVATLKSGEEVNVVGRFRGWAKVRTLRNRQGWVTEDGLMSLETHEAEERLLNALSGLPVQAEGRAVGLENLHIEPSRTAPIVDQVTPGRTLQIFGRRLVQRTYQAGTADLMPVSAHHLEAWYQIREGPHAGWILGHRVRLAFPKGISAYAQDANLVAWLVLNKVNDNGHEAPQYVVAERDGTETCDFTKIEVLTWWKRKETYAVAFREAGLQGYFPIVLTDEGTVPGFRLRLVDDEGKRFQKDYELFDTITRFIGSGNGWEGDVTPAVPGGAGARRRDKRRSSIAG